MVCSGFVTAWRFAICPTNRSPLFVIATIEGVSRAPSAFSKTVGSPASITATTEFVVPRSIPRTFAIAFCLLHSKIVCRPSPFPYFSLFLHFSHAARAMSKTCAESMRLLCLRATCSSRHSRLEDVPVFLHPGNGRLPHQQAQKHQEERSRQEERQSGRAEPDQCVEREPPGPGNRQGECEHKQDQVIF